MSAGAPVDFKKKLHDTLVDAGVLPDYKADHIAFKAALQLAREIVAGGPSTTITSSAEATPLEKVAVEKPGSAPSSDEEALWPHRGTMEPLPQGLPRKIIGK